MSKDTADKYVQIIQPREKQKKIDWQELYRFRELFGILVWRDVKVKYKQTALGALWAIIVPFVNMLIFTVIFGNVAKLPTDGLHPQLFYYTGLLLWTYFATAVSISGASLVNGKAFLTKIYFPRLIMPVSPILSALISYMNYFYDYCEKHGFTAERLSIFDQMKIVSAFAIRNSLTSGMRVFGTMIKLYLSK